MTPAAMRRATAQRAGSRQPPVVGSTLERRARSGETPRTSSSGQRAKSSVTPKPTPSPNPTAVHEKAKLTSNGRKSESRRGTYVWRATPRRLPVPAPMRPRAAAWAR